MDFTKIITSIDNLVKNGIPVRIIFDEMSVVKIGVSVVGAAIVIALFKKYILG